MEFSMKDTLRTIVETQSNGQETIMYDIYGNPNIMVRVDAYNEQVVGLAENKAFPAFIVDNNGREVTEIWVSKYKNSLGGGGVPVSWHGTRPMKNVTVADARALCSKKGAGWHLMTNLEWMAVAFMSWKTGKSKPGPSHNNPEIIASIHRDEKGFPMNEIGEPSLSHDGTIHGIIGMNGGYWEHVDGLYTMNTHGNVRNIYWNAAEDGSPINAFDNPNYKCVDNINLDCGRVSDTAPLHVDIDCDDGLSFGKEVPYPLIVNQFAYTTFCGSNFDALYPKTKQRDINWVREVGLLKLDDMTEANGALGFASSKAGLESRFMVRGGDIVLREGYCGLFGYYFYHQLNEGNDVTSFRSVYISK